MLTKSEPLFRAAANITKQKAGRELPKAKHETWKNSRGNADDPETNRGTNTQRDNETQEESRAGSNHTHRQH